MGLLDKSDYKFLWVTEFPQFEWSDEEERDVYKRQYPYNIMFK